MPLSFWNRKNRPSSESSTISTISPRAYDPVKGDPQLVSAVTDFAQQLITTTNGVLPGEIAFSVRVSDQHITINQENSAGIPLLVGGEQLLWLGVNFRCIWNSDKEFFAIDTSSFRVQPVRSNTPLFTFDYLRTPNSSTVPCSHINVHAHRDEVVAAMLQSGKRHRGKTRAKAVDSGKIPSLSQVHLPVGGHRFRPCIEDVLQMLIVEFGIDTKPGYQAVLDAGRSDYRSTQLRTAITDDLELAAEMLRERGYEVTRTSEASIRRHDRFAAF
ncbi:hypothetical protein B7R21_06495 [Subtercola boreus]|uniref:Uncharacterized protein n=1 Tax=Subtercola boreus TaxID=120213 RepID=A0A3E0VY49_9MICO|nr:hypothetical protein B7R21_06495 [Subtercola boreus]